MNQSFERRAITTLKTTRSQNLLAATLAGALIFTTIALFAQESGIRVGAIQILATDPEALLQGPDLDKAIESGKRNGGVVPMAPIGPAAMGGRVPEVRRRYQP